MIHPVRARALMSALVLLALAMPASAAVYRWVDDAGSVHYSDSFYDVPERYRQPSDDAPPRVQVVDGLKPEAPRARVPAPTAPLAPARTGSAAGKAWGLPFGLSETGAWLFLISNFWVAVLVLWLCCRMISEDTDGLKTTLAVFLQRLALFAALAVLLLTHQMALPGAALPDGALSDGGAAQAVLARAAAAPLIAFFFATLFALRFFVTATLGRGAVLALLFGAADVLTSGALLCVCAIVFRDVA